eukprot:1483187-Pyramimonas_sp.AAC.1
MQRTARDRESHRTSACPNLPPTSCAFHRDHHLGAVKKCVLGRRWACQARAVLEVREMVDHNSGAQKNRLRMKKLKFCGGTRPT